MTLGSYITKLRKGSGYTQMMLAQRLGSGQATIANWERNFRIPEMVAITWLYTAIGGDIEVWTSLYGEAYSKRLREELTGVR